MKKRKCMADGGVIEQASGRVRQAVKGISDFLNIGKPTETIVIPPVQRGIPNDQPIVQIDMRPDVPQERNPRRFAEEVDQRKQARSGGYARGGIMTVLGKGTGTSDSIPAIVAGQRVRLSNGEGAAILPAKTMKNAAAVHAIEEIIEATNGKPTATSDEDDAGMACGGVKARKMNGGGVLGDQNDEQKRKLTNNVVQTASTTSLYGGNPEPTPKGIADALTPGTGSSVPGVVRNGNSFTQESPNASAAAPSISASESPVPAVRPWYAGTDTRDDRTGLQQEQARVVAGQGLKDQLRELNGPSLLTTAILGGVNKREPVQQQASNGGRSTTMQDVNAAAQAPNPGINANIGNSGATAMTSGAQQVNMGAGFDPTKIKMADGYGMITDPKTGRTMMVSGAGAQTVAGGSVGAYGNSTVATDQLKAQLAATQAQGGTVDSGPKVSMLQSIPIEQAGRDRFTQFVRQSDADRLAHDLGTGGGNVHTNSGKVAALNAMRKGIADDLSHKTQVEVAGIHSANQLATEDARGRNQLANTDLVGQNQLAVEELRQSGPEKALRATKLQGEVEDANAQRAARQGLMSAIDAGNPTAMENAWRRGIAAGIVNPEKNATPYRFHTDQMGNSVRINEATGAIDALDRSTNTLKSVNAIEPAPRDPANLKIGQTYHTPNGPMIWRGTGFEPVQAR